MHVSLISDEKIEELTQGTDYTVTDRVVTLAAPTGLKIKIYRQTATKPLVGWADASVLRAADMTVQSTQLLHLAEETSDLAQEGGLSKDGTDNIWDARYNKIKNLLDPTDPGDAVNLNYITKNQTSLLTQLNNTGAAQNASIVSTGDTQNARLTSTGDTQNTRLNTTGTTQNTRLVTTGDSYVSTMTDLKDTTVTKAAEAKNSAALSKKWAMSDVSPDGVTGNKSAKTWAVEAKTSASNSASSATSSASSANASSASATKAKTSETNAATSATAAATSATNAATSATKAKTSETNAATSAAAAKQSEVNAKTWDPTQYAKLTETLLLTKHGKKLFDTNTVITDLNSVDVLSHPVWYCSFSSIAGKLSNCPTYTGFHLFNFSSSDSADGTYNGHLPTITTDWVYIIQLLIDINSRVWIRKCSNSGTSTFTFSDWKEMATTNLLPTKISQLTNDSGYVTEESVDAKIPTKTSQLTNDSGFATINSSGHLVINGSELWIE
nr:MAG TPA: L SHAPED TAIL FIBER PROTEIN [Caudoviricetes sp.]